MNLLLKAQQKNHLTESATFLNFSNAISYVSCSLCVLYCFHSIRIGNCILKLHSFPIDTKYTIAHSIKFVRFWKVWFDHSYQQPAPGHHYWSCYQGLSRVARYCLNNVDYWSQDCWSYHQTNLFVSDPILLRFVITDLSN